MTHKQIVTIFGSNRSGLIIDPAMVMEYGAIPATFLSVIISAYSSAEELEILDEKGYFRWKSKAMESILQISPFQQRHFISDLQEKKLIFTKYAGMPRKLWILPNFESIYKTLTDTTKAPLGDNSSYGYGRYILPSLRSGISLSSKEDNGACGTQEPSPKKSRRTINHDPLVLFWNNLESTPTHAKPNTKVYQRAVKHLKELKQGKFLHNKVFDNDWKKDNKQAISEAKRKWTDNEIKEVLIQLSELFMEGHWPEDKATIPRSLPDLLYNPRTQKSLFLWIPHKKQGLNTISAPDRNPDITVEFEKIIPILSQNDILKLRKAIWNIIDWHDKMNETYEGLEIGRPWFKGLHKLMNFIFEYCRWLKEVRYRDFTIKAYMIGPEAKNWAEFERYLEETYWKGEPMPFLKGN